MIIPLGNGIYLVCVLRILSDIVIISLRNRKLHLKLLYFSLVCGMYALYRGLFALSPCVIDRICSVIVALP